MSGLRRPIQTFIATYDMDPSRRDLFVEGNKDQLFFKWLTKNTRDQHSLIIKIDDIDIPPAVQGGNRARLIILASHLLECDKNSRVFIDSDFDRLLNQTDNYTKNIILSDGRDLESYLIREDCFDKFVSLSICTDSFTGSELLNSLVLHCRKLGFLRYLSRINNLDLPFQHTNLHRHIDFQNGSFVLDFNAYVRSLTGKARLNPSIMPKLLSDLDQIIEENNALLDTDIIHGNDLLCFIGEVLNSFDIDRTAASAVLCSSFERSYSADYPFLTNAINFLCETHK